MLIDWFTVGAQALNFLILVWLMRRFLYKPILAAIDAREKKIAMELADADARRAEAKKDRDEFQRKNEEFDQQRAALLTKATDEAKAERQRLCDEARQAADALSARRAEALKSEARNLNEAISRRTQEEVFSIARKALTDLATTSLEERMGEVFTRRLRKMDGKAKETLATALKTVSEPAVVRSAFDLPAEERTKIQNAINETFSAEVPLRFETAPDLIGGVELNANGQKVAWSLADYLTSLEKGVGELLKKQEKPEPQATLKPKAKPEAKVGSTLAPPPKPEADSKTPAEPGATIEPDAKPMAPATTILEVKPEPAKPEAEAVPVPEAKLAADLAAEHELEEAKSAPVSS